MHQITNLRPRFLLSVSAHSCDRSCEGNGVNGAGGEWAEAGDKALKFGLDWSLAIKITGPGRIRLESQVFN